MTVTSPPPARRRAAARRPCSLRRLPVPDEARLDAGPERRTARAVSLPRPPRRREVPRAGQRARARARSARRGAVPGRVGPDGPLAEAVEANVAVEKALHELEAAERELDAFLADLALRAPIGERRYREQAQARAQRSTEAQAKLAEARQPAPSPALLLTPGALPRHGPS